MYSYENNQQITILSIDLQRWNKISPITATDMSRLRQEMQWLTGSALVCFTWVMYGSRSPSFKGKVSELLAVNDSGLHSYET